MARKPYKPQPIVPDPEPTPEPEPITPQAEPEPTPQHAADDTLLRVLVLRTFQGRLTHEQRIEPGLYAFDDPRLFGLADYLIAHEGAQLVAG